MLPPTRWEALRRWFNNSGMIPLYRCGRCGGMASGGAVLYRSVRHTGPARVLHLPRDLLAVLRRERTWHPVPRFYAIVMGAALAPAMLIAVVTGARRWLLAVPAVAWAVAFAWSMTTVLNSPRVGQACLEVVAPARAGRRRAQHEVQAARRALEVLPVVAPVGWTGAVTIGGVGYSELRRGEPRPHALSVIADRDGSGRSTPRLTIRVADAGEPVEDDDGAWFPAEVRVDGERVPARVVTAGDTTLLRFELGDHAVTVTAEGMELAGLALERVHEPGPLMAAFERRVDQRLNGASGRPA